MLAPAEGAIAELALVLLLGRRAGFASRGGGRGGGRERHVGGGHQGACACFCLVPWVGCCRAGRARVGVKVGRCG